jgi:hypothetical protein
MPILSIQNSGDAVVRVLASANETFVVGTNAVSANCFTTSKEAAANIYTTGVAIKKVLYASDGAWQVWRQNASNGANVLILSLPGYGQLPLDAWGLCTNGVADHTSSNLVCQCTGSNGTLIMRLRKTMSPAQDYDVQFLNE